MQWFILIKNILFSIQIISFLLSFFCFLDFYKPTNSLIGLIVFSMPLLLSTISLLLSLKTKILFTLQSDDKFLKYSFLVTVFLSYFLIINNIYNFSIFIVILSMSIFCFVISIVNFILKKNLYHDKIFFASFKDSHDQIIIYDSPNKNISYFNNHVLFYEKKFPLSVVLEFEKIYGKKLVDFNELEIETLKMYSIS